MRRRYLGDVSDRRILITDTITILTPEDRGAIVVSGSHGGISSAQFAIGRGLAAVFYNDAGIGRDKAGIAGLAHLDGLRVAAMTFGHDTAEIGDGEDSWATGIVTAANEVAQRAGARIGVSVRDVATSIHVGGGDRMGEGQPSLHRASTLVGTTEVTLLDSVSMLREEDYDRIVVTGSHGGAVSGEFASRWKPRLVVFNDAGGGKNNAGWRALPQLDAAGVAAVAVSAQSARIGEPATALEGGVISYVNRRAAELGLATAPLADCIAAAFGG